MTKRTVRKIAAWALLFAAVLPLNCRAQLNETYVSVREAYGDAADSYTTQFPYGDGSVNIACVTGINARVATDTNVRRGPGSDTEVLTTLSDGRAVKVWGFADNEWCFVYCQDDEGKTVIGFIKDYLLFPPEQEATEAPEGE